MIEVLTCNECSPGGKHPIFDNIAEYREHRQKAHGDGAHQEPAPKANQDGSLFGVVAAQVEDDWKADVLDVVEANRVISEGVLQGVLTTIADQEERIARLESLARVKEAGEQG